jgi:DNA polymerase (family 10)
MDNRTIAQRLREYANYLESQEMNVYRVRAYRKAAETVLSLDRPVAEIVEAEGREGLEELPGIGAHLSGSSAPSAPAAPSTRSGCS